ncbi:PadR family transcriptional regulator [Roseivirga sp. E12]|uniref:PadR family transcriptional regulator n=1 Tax=Roseivirga sp. E12 TaxID=2819237 RepID=UPI001ABC6DBB|nr:PadR family transcriptional regulator [Roseivirga sp. E12]MBO3697554.1 PadR family transcriptional regulator [Roseivirga sp. E12]
MEKEYIGELEELILLLIVTLKDDAYGLSIRRALKEQANRTMTIGSVHGTLNRLEKKGLVTSCYSDATEVRGGRSKRIFTITASGKKALERSRDIKVNLWMQIPELAIK